MEETRETDSLIEAALAAQDSGEFATLEKIARELISRFEERSDKRMLSIAYRFLGTARHYVSDARGAETAYSLALEFAEDAGDDVEKALAMIGLGNMVLEQHNDVVEGRRLHEESEPIIRASGDKHRLAILTGNLGEIARVEGDYDRALAYAAESLDLFTEIGDEPRSAWQLINIALIRGFRRDYASAFEVLSVAFETLRRAPNAYWQAMYFDVGFMLAINLKEWELAAQLMGFTEKYRDEHRVPRLLGLMSAWYPPCVERLSRQVKADVILQERLQGAAMSLEQAQNLIDQALAGKVSR